MIAQGVVESDGACFGGYLGECRDGNRKMCRRYSERCEVRIGVIGDSLSDEYQGAVSALPGQTWSEQVQAGPRISPTRACAGSLATTATA